MDFTSLTVQALTGLSHIAGSYGLAIILLTVIVRLVMWPLSESQQRSMKKMQELSPKMKEIQNRYKNDPQLMQKKMMEFYKEHKFNPFGGCFPLLLQMPVFILLYTALISPQFNLIAGDSTFLGIRLDSQIRSHAGQKGDNVFGVAKHDTFSTEKTVNVYLNNGKVEKAEIEDTKKAIQTQGEIIPGKPLDLKMRLDQINLPFEQLNQVKKADVTVINNGTKEIEHLTFNKTDSLLISQVKTEQVKEVFHYDVLALVFLFGITMYISQKLMTSMNSNVSMDPAQKMMQEQMSKIMPVMITSTFVFIPIPAGVLIYMIASNIIQVGQTWLINKKIDEEEAKKPKNITNAPIDEAKSIKPKNVSDSSEDETVMVEQNKNSDGSGKKKNKKNKW